MMSRKIPATKKVVLEQSGVVQLVELLEREMEIRAEHARLKWVTQDSAVDVLLKIIDELRAADAPYVKCKCSEKQHYCHICEDKTDLACSDCRITFGASVYVCSKPFCRNEHERGYCCKPSQRRQVEASSPKVEAMTKAAKPLEAQCGHPHLTLLEGALHPGGRDYYCKACGEQFTTNTFNIRVGRPSDVESSIERLLYKVGHKVVLETLADTSSVSDADIRLVCEAAREAKE